LPGLLWLPLELLRCLHWRTWAASRRVEKAVAHYGGDVEARFGVSKAAQQERLAYWAKTWCINPFTGYDWQLYQPERDGLAIIYDNQTAAYHALCNRETGASQADLRLLNDKIALAEILAKHGIPVVETVRVTHGDWQDVETALTRHPKLFCKLRSGNQAESAFAVWRTEQDLQGLAHDGRPLIDHADVQKAWRILSAKGAVLIQPLLENHPALTALAVDETVCTVRIVTRVQNGGINPWWAELQVPDAGPGRGFWRFPVAVEHGVVSALGSQWFLKQLWQARYDATWQRLRAALQILPYWSEMAAQSQLAHRQVPKIWAIAWDWVLTPDGPVLLEGNGGWGLTSVQEQEFSLSNE
jgi:hypothetical protein